MSNWLKNRSLFQKLILVCSVFFVPIVCLLYTTVTAYRKDIDFARYEKHGDQYLRPLLGLVNEFSKHQYHFENVNRRQTESSINLSETRVKINQWLSGLETAQQEVGVELQFTDEGLKSRKRSDYTVENLKKMWAEASVIDPNHFEIEKVRELHTKMIAHVRAMVGHAGDTSNLILDPDLDSYYLMDVVLLALPQNMDRISQVYSYYSDLIYLKETKGATLKPEERTKLGVLASMLQEADVDRSVADIGTVLNEDANFYGSNEMIQSEMQKRTDGYKSAIVPIIESLKKAAETGQIVETLAAFNAMHVKAMAASYNFWAYDVDVLDQLLDARLGFYHSKANTALIFSFLSVIILLSFMMFSVKRISNSLAETAESVTRETLAVKTSIQSIDVASRQFSMAASQQAAAIQEAVAAMEEMSSMLTQTSRHAEQGKSIAEKMRSEADHGQSVVMKMSDAMGGIRDANSKVEALSKIIDEINQKTKVINDIVFETRLLSFNASIESARAGIHGKGFAVVAEEVGKLAAVSGDAADQIRGLLSSSSKNVAEVVDETHVRVSGALNVTQETVETFRRLGETVVAISESVTGISAAAREQEIGVRQTNTAMNELDKVTHKNAISAESLAGEAGNLGKGANQLDQSVQRLRDMLYGVRPESRRMTESDRPNDKPKLNKVDLKIAA